MLNWNVAVFAADDPDCDWKTFEETDTYVMENCVTENGYSARVRQKPIDGVNIEIVEAPKKKANPIQEFKDKVEEAPQIVEKIEFAIEQHPSFLKVIPKEDLIDRELLNKKRNW